jgi:hypothetical protein
MACGRAVVMTRTRGLWTGEDFRDGEHLKLVAAGDSRALGESVRSLIESPDLALKLGNQALGQVKQHGNIQSFATLLERLCT